MTPRYTHDCPACLFMGRHGQYDTYFCPKSQGDGDSGSVIARYGNEGHEYASSPTSCALACDLNLEEHKDAAHVAYVRLARRLLHEGYFNLTVNATRVAERKSWDT